MWIKEPTKLQEDFYFIGSSKNPIYLVRSGSDWVLIEGGLGRDSAIVWQQLQACPIDIGSIKHWVITHSHFDHCGTIESLYPHLPEVMMYASRKSIEHFKSKKYVAKIRQLNTIENDEHKTSPLPCNLQDISFNLLEEGTDVFFGGEQWEVLDTPGHSTCSISLYCPARGALFVSDALGEIIEENTWFPLAFQSMNNFISSVSKLSRLDVQFILLGHHGVLTGEHAIRACLDSLKACDDVSSLIASLLEDRTLEETLDELARRYGEGSSSFVPKYIYKKSMEQMIEQLKTEYYV